MGIEIIRSDRKYRGKNSISSVTVPPIEKRISIGPIFPTSTPVLGNHCKRKIMRLYSSTILEVDKWRIYGVGHREVDGRGR